jgi:hypothetical protein
MCAAVAVAVASVAVAVAVGTLVAALWNVMSDGLSLIFVFVESVLLRLVLALSLIVLHLFDFHFRRHNLNIANIQTSPNKTVYNILFLFISLFVGLGLNKK